MKTVLIIACLIIFQSGRTFAQRNGDCTDLFKRAFGKLKEINPERTGGLSVKYKVVAETKTGEMYYDSVDMSILGKKSRVVSSEFTIFQDEKTMVLIRPESNTIFLNHPVDKSIKNMKFQNIVRLQDSIFSKMILKSCVADKADARYKKLTFQFPADVERKIGMASVQYWIDEHQTSVRKLQFNYLQTGDQQMKTMSMEFTHVDTHATAVPFEGSATSLVFDSKNKLRSVYKNYALVDKRKN